MKRFFSLMLVALLLVSVLPFQALAATGVTVNIYIDNSKAGTYSYTGALNNWVSNIAEAVGYPYSTYHVSNYRNVTTNTPGSGNASITLADGDELNINVVKHNLTTTKTDATCTAEGKLVTTCSGCGYNKEEAIAQLQHSWGTGTVTTNPTCNTAGEKTFTCALCGATKKEAVAATGNHNFNAAGNCTVCGTNDQKVRNQVVFYIDEATAGVNKFYTETFVVGETIVVPTGDLIPNYEFRGWWTGKGGSGTQLTTGSAWTADKASEYYAWYVYNPAKDGTSTITVTARCYIDGIGTSYRDVPVLSVNLPDNTNVFDWLTANKNTTILTSVYNKVDTTKYEWKDRFFYNHNGSEVLTAQTVFADGPKSILIKLDEKDNTTRANVQLYLHKSSTSADPFRILDMNGYTSGMNVTRDAAAKLVKEYYSYSSIGNLYTDANWNALQRGENAYGATSIAITDNGTYKIHVVVSNASTKSNSNADTTNPKTGDYIMIAVGTMVLAAAAVITLAEMKKRKMI